MRSHPRLTHRFSGLPKVLWLILWLAMAGTPLLGQAPFPVSGGKATDLYSDPAFNRVWAFQEAHRYEESVPELQKIITESAGTELEAAALYKLAGTLRLLSGRAALAGNALLASDLKAQSDALWQEIVDRFPNTKYWLSARAKLLPGPEPYRAYYALLEEVGGPPYEAVRAGQLIRFPEEEIPIQYREYIKDLFEYGGFDLTFEEETRFRLFSLRSFPRDGDSVQDLRDFLLGKAAEGMDLSDDLFPPVVEASAPLDGARVLPGGGELLVTADDGVLRSSQIDMSQAVVELDGVDILPACQLDYRIDPTGPKAIIVEIRYSPPQPLSAGAHTYRVALQESGRGLITEKLVRFTVADAPPGPTTDTISSSKDALVYERGPHANEGANPRLTLEKITGKAARNLLGFDLSGVDINSLTKATLVLTIDPSDQVTGWGNGETVSVKPVTVAWQEGNGKKHGLPGNQQTSGSGAGTTWFSPTDENISNNSSNGVVQWNGAATYATTGTAPSLTVRNHQTGELRFDVTQDILNGAEHGWLLRKDAEKKGSKVSFYSREGSATLGPRLILEYADSQATTLPYQLAMGGSSLYATVADFFGISKRPTALQASVEDSEGPRGVREFLRGSAPSAYVGEQVLLGFAGRHPLAQLGARVAYRSWLRETPSLV